MCDYSLEMYGTQPAREGERYVTSRFPSGTIGLAASGAKGTAICLNCDTPLKLDNIPSRLRELHGLGAVEDGTFIRLEKGAYRDGVRFGNGAEVCFQDFEEGCGVIVRSLLETDVDVRVPSTERELAGAPV